MRLFSILLAVVALSACARAQIMNGGFEQWDTIPGHPVPDGWYGDYFGLGKIDTAHSGQFAVSLWNWYYYARGYLIVGSQKSDYLYLRGGGIPINFKPVRLTGYYKYQPGLTNSGHDSAVVIVWLHHFNAATGAADTITYVHQLLGPSDAYIPFSIPLPDRMPETQPDSLVIAFVSSDIGFCDPTGNGNCCFFSIDDVQLDGASGVAYDIQSLMGAVRVYPNPARGSLTVDIGSLTGRARTLAIFSADGRLVREEEVEGAHAVIDRGGLVSGAYLYELRDAEAHAIACGRFLFE